MSRDRRAGLAAGLALVAGLLSTAGANAHDGASTAYAAITISGGTVRYALTLSALPPGPLADALRPANPASRPDYTALLQAIGQHVELRTATQRCEAGPGHTTPPPPGGVNISATVDFACPVPLRELVIVDNLSEVLGDNLHTLARIETPDGTRQFVFAAESREARVAVGDAPSASRGAWSFVALGVEHILTGYDHLLFLLALVICGGSMRGLLLVITGFTVAHSVTLALAVVDLVSVPSRLVESLIALSIAYVAAENLFPRLAWSRRWTVSFAFGLVHGFGFSSVLRELGLPTESLLAALLGFNVGVELGQAMALVVVLPLVWWSQGQAQRPRLAGPVSALILAAGLGLFVERILA